MSTSIDQLRQVILDRTGLAFTDARQTIFERRVDARMEVLELKSRDQYVEYLSDPQYGHVEFLELIASLTNNETYLFRERETFKSIILWLLDQGKLNFRVLSAGVSSGEELVSFAVMLDQYGFDLDEITFVGMDLNVHMLETARNGVYGHNSFREAKTEHYDDYFVPQGDKWKVHKQIHQRLNYYWANLYDFTTMNRLDAFDVIICRNVLIYFEGNVRSQIAGNLYNLLKEGGLMGLGLSENISDLKLPLIQPSGVYEPTLYIKDTSTS